MTPTKPTTETAPTGTAPAAPESLAGLVQQAERAGASDMHFQMRGKVAEVGFRLEGMITPIRELPAEIAERVFGRIKFLARLKTHSFLAGARKSLSWTNAGNLVIDG
jgi:type II secretory ATPase GspE/PulE/Tfp pilus assembly ATPase PilB-like protein